MFEVKQRAPAAHELIYAFVKADGLDVEKQITRILDRMNYRLHFYNPQRTKRIKKIIELFYTDYAFMEDVVSYYLRVWGEFHFNIKFTPADIIKNDSVTEKQIKYLQSLGCKEMPLSKKHAGDLISKYKIL